MSDHTNTPPTIRSQLRALEELCGRHLVCFFAPQLCHGDLLLQLANGTREDRIARWIDDG